jgi:transcriptional regulator GlxA family with amidase domain
MKDESHLQVFTMAHAAQSLALVWVDSDPVSQLSRVCDVLRRMPRCVDPQDRVALALIVRDIAYAFAQAEEPRALPIEARLRRATVADIHLVRALAFMQREFVSPDLSLRAVADRCRISPAYLSHLFSVKTGHGFLTHLTAIRLLHSAFRLATSPLSIEEVADKCGWKSTAKLDHAFRQWFYMTPGEFRRWST